MPFKLKAPYQPAGDQPRAIQQLVQGIQQGVKAQTLLGVTGSGKTFTMANVMAAVQKPTLVISHNKTLAAQLYGELKQFFPENAVEYFVSYYDYYQPEAYLPATGVYIEKDLKINAQIEKLRLSTMSSLLTGHRDVVVVASVSCIYGLSDPQNLAKNVLRLQVGQQLPRKQLLLALVGILYSRSGASFERGTFRVQGDTVDVFLAYTDYAYRIGFFGDEVETLHIIEPTTGQQCSQEQAVAIFPANLFIPSKDVLEQVMEQIRTDLAAQVQFYTTQGRLEEAKRIQERTQLDLEMLRELGYCSGVENYSRYFDGRAPGQRPFCLLDYFPKDYLLMVDESHVTLPQIRAMWSGDRIRKTHLVDYAFRLPAALDNRPLDFEEFESLINQVVFVSATPAAYELQQSGGVVVEQIIRPTGLLDPAVTVKPSKNQIDDLLEALHACVQQQARALVITLTKHLAEELTQYLAKAGIRCRYLHSTIKTLERVEILRDLRLGKFDVLVGVNLLREGLDLPEVALVAIFDADQSGFLRNATSLIQLMGRAARHVQGRVILYADTITPAMEQAIGETKRRRTLQMAHNKAHHITPKPIATSTETILQQTDVANYAETMSPARYAEQGSSQKHRLVAEPEATYKTAQDPEKHYQVTQKRMQKAAQALDFVEAARLRDELKQLEKLRESRQ